MIDNYERVFFRAYKVQEAADILGMHHRTLRRYMADGKIMYSMEKKRGKPAYRVIHGWAIVAYQSDEKARILKAVLDRFTKS